MSRTGPVAKNTTNFALGLAQVRVGASATNIAEIDAQLTSSNSVGALANTKFMSEVDYYKVESGYPLKEDTTIPLREKASLECSFREISPFTLALARGLDAVTDNYSETLSGEILLGAIVAPDFLRMEAIYTFPNGTSTMSIIFPRAQVVSNVELDWQTEDEASIPVVFEAKSADSSVSGGNAVWDSSPLGHILFAIN